MTVLAFIVLNGIKTEISDDDLPQYHFDYCSEPTEPSAEERLEALEAAMLDVLEVLANG